MQKGDLGEFSINIKPPKSPLWKLGIRLFFIKTLSNIFVCSQTLLDLSLPHVEK
jgi:hypothetical protein